MIIALIIAAVGLAATGPLTAFLGLRYLRERDEHDRQERAAEREDRQLLVQRIQAPEVAVAQAVKFPDEDRGWHAEWDDEGYQRIIQERDTGLMPSEE